MNPIPSISSAAQINANQANQGAISAAFNTAAILNGREIFHVPPGFDLVVDYGAGNQVCKLQVPALMPTDAKVQNADDMRQKMHAFLAELVPDSIRGKELQRFQGQTGAFSARGGYEYDHVRIVETYSGSNDTITVWFKNAACQQKTHH